MVTATDSANTLQLEAEQALAPASLYHIGYSSTLSSPLSASELIGLLKSARKRNRELDVTGLLLHREDSFFQVLEGSKENVLSVFSRIELDPRHIRVTVLFEGQAEVREYRGKLFAAHRDIPGARQHGFARGEGHTGLQQGFDGGAAHE